MAFTESKIQQATEAAAKAVQAQAQAPLKPDEKEVFGIVISSDEIMVLILAIVLALAVVSFVRAHRSRSSDINLVHLILGADGRISPERFIVMVAFSLHSWAILKWIVSGAITSAEFVSYGAIWVSPLIVALLKNGNAAAKPPPP